LDTKPRGRLCISSNPNSLQESDTPHLSNGSRLVKSGCFFEYFMYIFSVMELLLIPWTLLWAIVCSLIGARKGAGKMLPCFISLLLLFTSLNCANETPPKGKVQTEAQTDSVIPPYRPNHRPKSKERTATKTKTKVEATFPIKCEAYGEWFTHWGHSRYLIIKGRLRNTLSSETFNRIYWSSKMDIILKDKRVITHRNPLANKSILGGRLSAIGYVQLLLPRKSIEFEIDTRIWNDIRIRDDALCISSAELTYPIQSIHLSIWCEAHTPTGLVFKGQLIDADIPSPQFRKRFRLKTLNP